jgi:hypothetical protein
MRAFAAILDIAPGRLPVYRKATGFSDTPGGKNQPAADAAIHHLGHWIKPMSLSKDTEHGAVESTRGHGA